MGGTLSNCTLMGNSAEGGFGGGANGGTLNNCTLTANKAWYGGGAAGSMLNNCVLGANWAYYSRSILLRRWGARLHTEWMSDHWKLHMGRLRPWRRSLLQHAH